MSRLSNTHLLQLHAERRLEYNIDDEYCTMATRLEQQEIELSDDDDPVLRSRRQQQQQNKNQCRGVSMSPGRRKPIRVAAPFSSCPDRINDIEQGKWRPRRRGRTQMNLKALQRCSRSILRRINSVPTTTSLPILVLVDMFAVSLVVPLLFQYYKDAGVTSATQRELLSSLFSCAQIVGGLLMGVLADAKFMRQKTIFYFSFGGSALSYALIVHGKLFTLILSRLIVGLVKQTMTIATTILTEHTTKANRTLHMGRLTASSTVAWIVGPSTGALLFKYVDRRAPAVIACALFCLNFLLAGLLLNDDDNNKEDDDNKEDEAALSKKENNDDLLMIDGKEADLLSSTSTKYKRRLSHSPSLLSTGKCTSILSNLRSCFSSPALGAAVITKLIATWVTKATNYSQLGSFYEDMYGVEPHQRGYISSYQQFLEFVVQSALVGPILALSGGERQTICLFTALLAATVLLESLQSLSLFLALLCPLISLCFSMTNLSMQTLVTHVAPSQSIFSVLAALDVLQNAVSVSIPFYRTFLFRYLAPAAIKGNATETKVMMQGDPDPVAWIYSSALHWFVAAIAISYLLLSHESSWWKEQHEADKETPRKRKGK